jgi:pimeloyl-ACP methyl ester carboxylesterase
MSTSAQTIPTSRLNVHVRFSGPETGIPVLFIHGNASSSIFWKEIMEMLPPGFRGIAPDMRGYGDTDDVLIDATRGLGDFTDDLVALLEALHVNSFHLIGHSLGGSIAMTLTAAASVRVKSVTLVNPGSPFGFGGTKSVDGQPCWPDFAGSGGGIVNPVFARLIGEKYRGTDDPHASPRVVMNSFYWKPPFVPHWEEELLDGLLSEKIGPDKYPGDMIASPNYPFAAPGILGPVNAMSPKYVHDSVERFVQCPAKPPVLWVRGSDDQIVSDQSLFCLGTLGKLGLIPNYPGEDVYPPQPMVSQTRHMLDRYTSAGGHYSEVVMPDTGHSPFIEKPGEFMEHFSAHLSA